MSQRMFKEACFVDTDEDSQGEYGTFEELAGTDPSRLNRTLEIPLLSGAFTKTEANGLLIRSGYCYQIFLPDAANDAEESFVAIAWPASYGNSGNRCFYVDERGEVYAASNEVWRFSGPSERAPRAIVNSLEFQLVR